MTGVEAIAALGGRATRHQVRQAVKALSLHPWGNSADERQRLAAGQWALRNWGAYAAACAAIR